MKPLNPVMAALLAAVSATCASPRLAFAAEAAPGSTVPTPKGTAVFDGTEKDSLAALKALIVKSDAAKAAVGARVQQYVLDDKLKFAGDDVRGSEADKKAIGDVVIKWVGGAPEHASYLYYVLAGGGDAPDWAKGDPAASKLFGAEAGKYAACLDARLTKAPQSQVGKIRESGMSAALAKFLAAAGDGAVKVLLNCGDAPKKNVAADIKAREAGPQTPAVPGSAVAPGNGQPDPLASNKEYGFNDLYVQGSQVANIYRDGKDGYRVLSVKMYSVPQTDGSIMNQLGVVDITNPGTVFAPTFVKLPLSGKTTVTVYGGAPDGSAVTRSYDLLANYDQITLSRPGTTPGPGSGTMTFTAQSLLQTRAAQAAQQGTTMIDGKPYYVLGQGGKTGTFMFFDPSNMRSGQPTFVSGDISVKDQSGGWGRSHGKPNLNPVTPDQNQNPFHLEWVNGHWTVVAGPGDAPPGPTPAPGAPADPNAPAAAPATKPQASALDANSMCGDAQCEAYTDAYTKRDAGADFSDAAKQRVFLLRDKKNTTSFFLRFAKPEVQGGMLTFSAAQVPGLIGVRGYQDSIALEIKTAGKLEVQYLPIQGVLDQFNSHKVINNFADFSDETVKSASDLPVVLDMITYYASAVKDAKGATVAKATAIATIKARAAKRIAAFGGKAYTIGGTVAFPNAPLSVFGDTFWEVWPGDKATQKPGAKPADAGLSGPGAVADIATSGDAAMPAATAQSPLDIGGGVTLTRKDPQNGADIGLYQSQDGKDWYMFLRVARDGGTARTGAVKINGGPLASWMKNPSAVSLQGLAGINPPLPVNAPPMQFVGTPGKGAYVVYRYAVPAADGSNVKDKPGNCAGAVIWFGLTPAAAQKACADGHL